MSRSETDLGVSGEHQGSLVVRVIDAVYSWLFRPKEHHGISVARVAFGGALFSHYLQLLPYLNVFYLPSGINGSDFHERFPEVGALEPHPLSKFDFLTLIDGDTGIIALYLLLLVSAFAFTVGAWTRVAGVTLALLHMVFGGHQPSISWGWAHLVHAFVLYAVFANAGRVLSFDAWWRRRRGRSMPPPPPAVGIRLLQLHLCTMYTVAGWERIDAPAWLAGQMVTLAVVNSRFSRFEVDWMTWQPVLSMMNYATYVLEPLAPIALWIPRLVVPYALALMGMHVGLELLSHIGHWQWIMFGGLCVFLPARWFTWAAAGISPKHA